MTSSPTDFVLFGPSHLLTLAVVVVLSVGLPLWVRRQAVLKDSGERLARQVALVLAVIQVVHEPYKAWLRITAYDLPWIDQVPIQVCNLMPFLTAVMLVTRHQRLYELVYFWGLAGTLQATLTPDLPWAFPDLLYTTYYINHGLIIVGIFYATIAFRLRPTGPSILRVYLFTLAYAFLFVGPLNLALGTNFLYMCEKPEGATLVDYFGPWPWYILVTSLFGLASFVFYYLPFWLLDRFRSEPVQEEAPV